MSGIQTPKQAMANTLKIYVFPALVTILATLIWRDVTEMRNDVKALLAQSNVDKTEIQQLKKEVDQLNRQVFKTPMITASVNFNTLKFFHDGFFKHEDFFDVNKYIPKTEL
jgi:hypothetical protein